MTLHSLASPPLPVRSGAPRPRVLGLAGSVTRPSRTSALVAACLDAFGDRAEVEFLQLVDEAPALFGALTRKALAGRSLTVVEAVESADILVVASPVYRASYSGALKHLFDLVDHRAFPGKPVILAATGGTPMHGLVTEHQLRPLFGFLNALTVPTTIYALESDFQDFELASATISQRIARAVSESLVLWSRTALTAAGSPTTGLPRAANA